MTVEAAGALYLQLVVPINSLVVEWETVGETTKATLPRKKIIAGQIADAYRVLAQKLQANHWPEEAAGPVQDLIKQLAFDLTSFRSMSISRTINEFTTAFEVWEQEPGGAAEVVRLTLGLGETPR